MQKYEEEQKRTPKNKFESAFRECSAAKGGGEDLEGKGKEREALSFEEEGQIAITARKGPMGI